MSMAGSVECHGRLKVTSHLYGNSQWREGKLLFTDQYDKPGVWKCLVYFTANPKREPQSYRMSNRVKAISKPKRIHLDFPDGTSIVATDFTMDKTKFDEMMKCVQDKHGKCSDRRVLAASGGPANQKSHNTSTPVKPLEEKNQRNGDVSPTVFTEVKENRNIGSTNKPHFGNPFEQDEIQNYKSPNRYLESSQQKCREALASVSANNFYGNSRLYGHIPATYSKVNRRPGFLTDPTSKRSRMGLDVNYSWLKKPATSLSESKSILQGFSNLGNTCYMNAILQSLYGLETFSGDLAQLGHEILKTPPSKNTGSLHRSLCKLLRSKKQNNPPSEQRELLSQVKSAISKSVKRFSGNEQHDAHEFLCQVLDQLKEEVMKINKEDSSPTVKDIPVSPIDGFRNPTTMNFEFEVLHTIRCLDCGHDVTKTECFHDLSIEMPRIKDLFNTRSIQDALDLFFRREQLEYTCEDCQSKRAEVMHHFTRLPRVLILHLKRYNMSMCKLGQNIVIPKFLTLEPHCDPDALPNTPPDVSLNEHRFNKSYQSESEVESNSGTPRRKLDFHGNGGYGFKRIRRPVLSDPSNSDNDFESTPKKQKTSPSSTLSEVLATSRLEQEQRVKKERDEETALQKAMAQSLNESKKPTPSKLSEYTLDQVSEDDQLRMAMERSLSEQNGGFHGSSNEHGENNMSKEEDVKPLPDLQPCEMDGLGSDFDFYSQISNSTANSDFETGFLGNKCLERELGPINQHSQRHGDNVPVSKGESLGGPDEAQDELACSMSNTNSDSLTAIKTTPKLQPSPFLDHTKDHVSLGYNGLECLSKSNQQEDESDSGIHIPSSGKKSQHIATCKTPLHSKRTQTEVHPHSTSKKSKDISQKNSSENSEHKSMYSIFHSKYKKSLSCIPRVQTGGDDCFIVDSSTEAATETSPDELMGTKEDKTEVSCISDEPMTFEDEDEVMTLQEEPIQPCLEKGTMSPVVANEEEADNESRPVGLNVSGEEENKENKTPPSSSKTNSSTQKEDPEWLKAHSVPGEDEEEQLKRALEMSLKEQLQREKKEQEDLMKAQKLSLQDWDDDSTVVDMEGGPDPLDNLRSKEEQEKLRRNARTGELPYSYQLMSVVSHIGSSSSVGHYITDVNDLRNKQWLSFDDSEVSRITASDVIQKRQRSGYIFFYLNKDIVQELEEYFRNKRKSSALSVAHQNRPASR